MNSCVPASFNRLGFRLLFERGIQVSMCGALLNVFFKKSFSSQSLVLGYLNEFVVCQQPQIVRAVSANNYAVPCRQPLVSAERGKGRSFRRSSFEVRPTTDRYQFPSSRIEGCFRDSEKRFGFQSLYVSSRSGFVLATAALYLLEIRSNSAEFGSSINGLRQKSPMALLDSAAR